MKFHDINMVGPFVNERIDNVPVFNQLTDQGRLLWSLGDLWFGTTTKWVRVASSDDLDGISMNHNELNNLFVADQHPISAIIGLQNILDTIGNFVWEMLNTSATLEKSKGYFIDTTIGPITVSLPLNPTIGDTVKIADIIGNFDTNNVTVWGNGNKIMGLSENMTLCSKYLALTYTFSDITNGWVITDGKSGDCANAGGTDPDPGDGYNPTPPNMEVVGGITGLDFNLDITGGTVSTDTIVINEGFCMDSTNIIQLVLSTNTSLTLTSPTSNTIYHVFLTPTGPTFSVNEDGSDITSSKRWLGFIRTDSNSDIVSFQMKDDEIRFIVPSDNNIAILVAGAWVHINFSVLIPINKVKKIAYGCVGASSVTTALYTSLDGTNVFENVQFSNDDNNNMWASMSAGLYLTFSIFNEDYYYAMSGSGGYIKVHSVIIIR